MAIVAQELAAAGQRSVTSGRRLASAPWYWLTSFALVTANVAWVGAEALSQFGPIVWMFTAGLTGFTAAWLVRIAAATGTPIDAVQRTATAVVVLMLNAYVIAAYAVAQGVFTDDGPYVLITLIYCATLAVLLAGAYWKTTSLIVRGATLTVLCLIGILATYSSWVIIELAIEVPSLLSEHISGTSQPVFYHLIVLAFLVLASATIMTGVLRVSIAALLSGLSRVSSSPIG